MGRRRTATETATETRSRSTGRAFIPFPHKLVLNQWLLSLFNVNRMGEFTDRLKDERNEGLDENQRHHYCRLLTSSLFNLTNLTTAELERYDENIVSHTLRLNERRSLKGQQPVKWKYFQYLALLFTEIYLDRYFRDAAGLRLSINKAITAYNDTVEAADQLPLYDVTGEARAQLNKLAFWMATGSGKTLLMHANLLQYQHYHQQQHGGKTEPAINKILLLTPNEGLSQQHLREFEISGLEAELFSKEGSGPDLFTSKAIEIIEVTRLVDEKEGTRRLGEKSLSLDAFEGNNLVMVDEGHRGTSSGEEGQWMKARNALCETGFSFEYSATFAQAVAGKPRLIETYARNVLFNYSYSYFYEDGFGKDYQILNLDEATEERHLELYLVGCLLTYYQQLRLFVKSGAEFKPFLLEKPLWVFVGGSVTKSLSTKDASDVVQILQFLARYVGKRKDSIRLIREVLQNGLKTASGMDLFDQRFVYLNSMGLSAEAVYAETLELVFHAPQGGALHVENLKEAAGEVALRLGVDNPPFGVINVGEDKKLVDLCQEKGLQVANPEFGGSLFHGINQAESPVNVLIGSKKFTEGWSSWRVSTMGLMNVGRGEGAQIIQLFGRGVRLKGYDMCLKRSKRAPVPEGVKLPKHINQLETLGIFGIRADYMNEFKKYLMEEGLKVEQKQEPFLLPVVKNLTGTPKLKIIRLKKKINGVSTEFGEAFRKLGPIPTLQTPGEVLGYLRKHPVEVNWYPKIAGVKSKEMLGGEAVADLKEGKLGATQRAFLNLEQLYFDLERFKAERGWYNLNLTRAGVRTLLEDEMWYRLQIPPEQLIFDRYDRVRVWQEIALVLLKKYVERFYLYCKREWELKHLEYQPLNDDDPNLLGAGKSPDKAYYEIMLDRSRDDLVAKLLELKDMVDKKVFKPWEFAGLKALWFGRHLFSPLLSVDKTGKRTFDVTPAALDKSERWFVEDLMKYQEQHPAQFAGKELYVLRNLSRGRGVGFFEAGNFYPDFIVWLVAGTWQSITFVDPKGLIHLAEDDPKIEFHQTIKEIEKRLGDASVTLHSFIISNTGFHQLLWRSEMMTKEKLAERNVLFQAEDRATYIEEMVRKIIQV